MELFGLRLKTLRQGRDLSQEQLADMLEIGKATISGYERSAGYPSIEVLVKICRLFEVSADFMLGLSDSVASKVSNLTDDQYSHVMGIVLYLEQLNNMTPQENK